jgi:micrococcal nuclease
MLRATVLALLIAATPALAAEGWIARDGDTIVSPAGERIRVANVDTAEMACRCAAECNLAQAAKRRVQALLDRARHVELRPYQRARDKYGRTLAYVVLDGRDLGDALVGEGLARRWDGARRPWCGS